MSTRKTIILAYLLAAMTLPAFANNCIAFVGRSGGFQFQTMPSSVTRAQVQKELAEWRKNPVTAHGYRDVGGEKGVEYVVIATIGAMVAWYTRIPCRTIRPNPVLL